MSDGAELEGQENISHAISSNIIKRLPRLPHTGFGMRVAGALGDRYFIHFEVVE